MAVPNIMTTLLGFILLFGPFIIATIIAIKFYRRSKQQETEIAVLKERIKNYADDRP